MQWKNRAGGDCRRSSTNGRWLPAFAVAALALSGASAPADTIDWVLAEPDCDDGESVRISCASHGVFYLFTQQTPAGCGDVAHGDHDPRSYPEPPEIEGFPQVPWEDEPTQPFRVAGGGAPVESEDALRVSVVDFNSTHGTSTWWLADELGGEAVSAELYLIDDPSYDEFGPVGDFHLLASVCGQLEEIEVEGRRAPLVINLSLGRLPQDGEPPSLQRCRRRPENLLCQLQQVIERLRAHGSHVLAASGNHAHELVPAAFENVGSVGALDLSRMLNEHHTARAWETAPEATGLFPGNGLCLRGGFAAPAGSSYSSAIFSGWLAAALLDKPYLDPVDDREWGPRWSDEDACYELAAGNEIATGCAPALEELVDRMRLEACWDEGGSRIESTLPLPAPDDPPVVQTYDAWADLHPTPASDPCIPCSGGPSQSPGFTSDIAINMSESPALPNDYFLREVYVRFDDTFYPTGLDAGPGSPIEQIQKGELDYLVLPGWMPLVEASDSASLFYVMSADEHTNCADEPEGCFWRSTQILWLSTAVY